jgi:hypothetical protein
MTRILPSAADARVLVADRVEDTAFTEAMSSLKFGTTFKTTSRVRFPLTIHALAALEFRTPPTILDVGASDGTTSLDIMRGVGFSKYHVTDRNIEVFVQRHGDVTWFFDESDACIMAVADRWVAYQDCEGAWPFLGAWARQLFARAPMRGTHAQRVTLISPALRRVRSELVEIRRHDIFERWPGEQVDLVIAANILNRAYFPDSSISNAVRNLIHATKEGGRIAIVDSRESERSTIFRVSGGLAAIEKSLNGGTDIEALVLETSGYGHP